VGKDIRICFVGDSFIQGIGDPEHRGWVGRVLQATHGEVTAFNLGIRRNTSEDVRLRCWAEVAVRTVSGADNRLVMSFGSNDMIEEDGRIRVDPGRCLRNVAALLDECERRELAALMVGPPPVIDAGESHLRRTSTLADAIATLCRAHDVPFIDTTRLLADDPTWNKEVLAGDGAHPGRGGYQRLADIVLAGGWQEWIGSPTDLRYG
jgi:acyl-CoA thioesterase I